jgi:hypothetical protein
MLRPRTKILHTVLGRSRPSNSRFCRDGRRGWVHLKTTALRYIDQMEGHHLANGVGSVFKIKAGRETRTRVECWVQDFFVRSWIGHGHPWTMADWTANFPDAGFAGHCWVFAWSYWSHWYKTIRLWVTDLRTDKQSTTFSRSNSRK